MSVTSDVFYTTNSPNNHKEMADAVVSFKSAVDSVRNILRTDGIVSMDSMRHISLYILSRSINTEMAKSLNIPEEFAWENMYETAMTKNGGVQYAFECFYNNQGGDCLVHHFDRIFKTEKFSFDIKSPKRHKEIMEIINRVDFNRVQYNNDILGWVYEQHLGTGSSKANRDLGQCFTMRPICGYMVKLCKPGFKSPGVPESVCDPTMGTGGLLTAYVKYFKKEYSSSPINWFVQSNEIHGGEIEAKVAGVARLNLFMETSGIIPYNLKTGNSLYDPNIIQETYDVILANIPFGVKKLNYDDCCERIKNLKIKGNSCEPLFMQLIMTSLNKGGRCAVVVSSGMLENSCNQAVLTRKYLFDHFELKRVIKMDGKFFMNTGIKPSILYFENTGKPTSEVEFWSVIKTDKDEIVETMVLNVPREKFDKAYTLDVRRYQEDGKNVAANPAGYPVMKLGDVVTFTNGKNIPERDRSESGIYPYYASNGISGYVDKFNFNGCAALIGDQGSCWTKSTHYVEDNVKFYAGNHTMVIKSVNSDLIVVKYVYYYLKLSNLSNFSKCSALIPEMDKERFKNMEVPIPPIEIQREIVETLDRIYAPGTTELADTIKLTDKAMDLMLQTPDGTDIQPIIDAQRLIKKSAQMVADVRAQMVAIVKSVERRGFELKRLDDVCKFVGGKGNQDRSSEYKIPYYEANGIFGYVNEALYTGEYVITARKMSIGAVHYVNGPFYPSDNTINMTSSDITKLNNRYLYFWLILNNRVLKDLSSGIKPGIRKSDVIEIKMPIPPLDFQKSLVDRLDALQSQLDSLTQLQKQSEDTAKFILESYLSSPEIVAVPEASEVPEEPVSKPKPKKKKLKVIDN